MPGGGPPSTCIAITVDQLLFLSLHSVSSKAVETVPVFAILLQWSIPCFRWPLLILRISLHTPCGPKNYDAACATFARASAVMQSV